MKIKLQNPNRPNKIIIDPRTGKYIVTASESSEEEKALSLEDVLNIIEEVDRYPLIEEISETRITRDMLRELKYEITPPEKAEIILRHLEHFLITTTGRKVLRINSIVI